MRRRKREQTITLFSFQDIITGVAGVMLFVLLLLVVQLTLRSAAAAVKQETESVVASDSPKSETDPSEPSYEQVQRDLQKMKAELDRLQERSKALLQAMDGDIDAKIAQTQNEIDDLIRQGDERKGQAEQLADQIAAQNVSEERRAILARRDELKAELQSLESERELHARGKLVAFRTDANRSVPMWVIDLRDQHVDLFDVNAPRNVTALKFDRETPPAIVSRQIHTALREKTNTRNVILLLRPSVAGLGVEYLAAIRAKGLNVALELLDEDTLVTEPIGHKPDHGKGANR